ncbi:DUF4157 domain-containing protein [Nakamurella silvestris]|nr:DUF4157 domain-containing protein [Nakamurella silvestris]
MTAKTLSTRPLDRHLTRLAEVGEPAEVPQTPMPQAAGLTVGAAHDPAEADADRRAGAALRRLDEGAAHRSRPEAGPQAHRHNGDCEHVQRSVAGPAAGVEIDSGGGTLGAETTSRIERARSGGVALADPVRRRMEAAFDADFSQVRVHTGGEAADLNRSVSARAFATGNDLFFGAGQYAPDTREGEQVLAHELAHTVQQGAGGVQRSTVHRLLTAKETDVQALRSDRGLKKGARTKDTLDLLGRVLSLYHIARSPEEEHQLLGTVVGVCQTYLNKHAHIDKKINPDDAAKVAFVEEVFLHARVEFSKAQAEAQYVKDAGTKGRRIEKRRLVLEKRRQEEKAAEAVASGEVQAVDQATVKAPETKKAAKKAKKTLKATQKAEVKAEREAEAALQEDEKTQLNLQTEAPSTVGPATALASGRTADGHGAGEQALALVKEYGLTTAEIIAIKTYSVGDYGYMNAAVSNDEGWQRKTQGQAGPVLIQTDVPEDQSKWDEDVEGPKRKVRQKANEEGSLHAAFALRGLKKFPPLAGTVYRGARFSQENFDKQFGGGEVTFNAFTSTGQERHIAQSYADGAAGTARKADNETISVLCVIEVKTARDIVALSLHPGETEWLILPGTKFSVDDIVTAEQGQPGESPSATEWRTVYMSEKTGPENPEVVIEEAIGPQVEGGGAEDLKDGEEI